MLNFDNSFSIGKDIPDASQSMVQADGGQEKNKEQQEHLKKLLENQEEQTFRTAVEHQEHLEVSSAPIDGAAIVKPQGSETTSAMILQSVMMNRVSRHTSSDAVAEKGHQPGHNGFATSPSLGIRFTENDYRCLNKSGFGDTAEVTVDDYPETSVPLSSTPVNVDQSIGIQAKDHADQHALSYKENTVMDELECDYPRDFAGILDLVKPEAFSPSWMSTLKFESEHQAAKLPRRLEPKDEFGQQNEVTDDYEWSDPMSGDNQETNVIELGSLCLSSLASNAALSNPYSIPFDNVPMAKKAAKNRRHSHQRKRENRQRRADEALKVPATKATSQKNNRRPSHQKVRENRLKRFRAAKEVTEQKRLAKLARDMEPGVSYIEQQAAMKEYEKQLMENELMDEVGLMGGEMEGEEDVFVDEVIEDGNFARSSLAYTPRNDDGL